MFQDPKEAIPSQPMLQELVNQLPALISFIQSASDLPESERETYLTVIGHFEPVLQMSMPPRVDNRELRFLFFWPLHLQPDYLTFLRQRHAGALSVLMYYTTLLVASQSRYWFMQGWGEQLLRACYEELKQDWEPCVRWPLSFINHKPTYSLFANLVQSRQSPGTIPQEPDENTSGYPPRRPVEIPYRQYATVPLPSHEIGREINVVAHAQQIPQSSSPHDHKARAAAYAKQSGPAEDAE